MLDVEWQVVGRPRECVFAVLGVCQWCSASVHRSTVYSLWCGLRTICVSLTYGVAWGGGGGQATVLLVCVF